MERDEAGDAASCDLGGSVTRWRFAGEGRFAEVEDASSAVRERLVVDVGCVGVEAAGDGGKESLLDRRRGVERRRRCGILPGSEGDWGAAVTADDEAELPASSLPSDASDEAPLRPLEPTSEMTSCSSSVDSPSSRFTSSCSACRSKTVSSGSTKAGGGELPLANTGEPSTCGRMEISKGLTSSVEGRSRHRDGGRIVGNLVGLRDLLASDGEREQPFEEIFNEQPSTYSLILESDVDIDRGELAS